jgi:hypothetical protein
MEPWNINIASEKDEQIELERRLTWRGMQSKDFYFAVLEGDEDSNFITTVFIVPIAYFDEHHKRLARSMPIEHIVPDYLVEIYDCTFTTRYNVVMVANDLARRGFVRGGEFQKHINRHFEIDTSTLS